MARSWADVGIDVPTGRTGEVLTTCPKCSRERKKKQARCLSANVDTGLWVCHHCGWAGGLGGREDRHEPGWRKPRWRAPALVPPTPLPEKVLAWFRGRGITEAVLSRNQIGFARVYMPQIEDEADAIVFPYRRNGDVVNHKYRDGRKNFRMDTGAERIFYGLDDVAETTVVVEGEIDKLSMEVAGITACISVPDGAPAPGTKDYSSKFTFLDSAESVLAVVAKFVLAVDNDAAGQRLEDEIARRLGRERCWRVRWPSGCKDANEVLLQYGANELRDMVDAAEPYPIEGVFSALGESSKVYALYRSGAERGVSTGWKLLDQYYTVRPGELTIVIGIPGSGKSEVIDCLCVNLARLHGWSCGLFSPENQPLEDHVARIIEKYIGIPFNDGPTPRMTESDVQCGLAWAHEHMFWMLPNDEKNWDVEWVLARARELVVRHGIRVLVIDPWNELEPQRAKTETETEYVSRVLRTIRQFARRNGVHVFLVVHPTKLYRNDQGNYPVPTLYDAAGSAHFRSKADNGLCVWRDFSTPDKREIEIHIQKIRFRQIGRLGKVTLLYDPPTATYSEPTSEVNDALWNQAD